MHIYLPFSCYQTVSEFIKKKGKCHFLQHWAMPSHVGKSALILFRVCNEVIQ